MDEALAKIEQSRLKLLQAFNDATDATAKAKIRDQLLKLADLQDAIILQEITNVATALNRLSDVLDEAIKAIQRNISNLLLGDLKQLHAEVEGQAGRRSGAEPPAPPPPSPGGPPAPPPPGGGLPSAIIRPAATGDRHVHGPVVMALQLALGRAGQAVEPDGDFGSLTFGALRRWQVANAVPAGFGIDAAQWLKLTGRPAPSIFDLCLNLTSDFEGTSFDRVVGNFDGAGITFGLIGFTLANGELARLLASIEARKAGAIASAFGALFAEFDGILKSPKADQLAWADSVSRGPSKMDVVQPLKDAFRRLGSLPEARDAQIRRAYDIYWAAATRAIATYMADQPLTAADAALWFDAAVQNDLTKVKAKLTAVAASGATGRPLREAFAEAIASGSVRFRADVLSRKMTIATGRGTVHGGNYGLDAWGLTGRPVSNADLQAPSTVAELIVGGTAAWNEETTEPSVEAGEAGSIGAPEVVITPPGARSPHAGWELYDKFVSFVGGLGLQHFSADELLYLGGQNALGQSCAGLNSYPPEPLWPNVAPTAAILDRLRADMGKPVHILSAYRSPAYNTCISGAAANSVHMRYMAIDFVCDAGTPSQWTAKLADYRLRGLFRGGIGTYSSFVHVDTRGENRNWTG
jgi:hypothetical protein